MTKLVGDAKYEFESVRKLAYEVKLHPRVFLAYCRNKITIKNVTKIKKDDGTIICSDTKAVRYSIISQKKYLQMEIQYWNLVPW